MEHLAFLDEETAELNREIAQHVGAHPALKRGTGGKSKSGQTRKGNPWERRARSATRTKDSEPQRFYQRLKGTSHLPPPKKQSLA
jgi:hypothetical protein